MSNTRWSVVVPEDTDRAFRTYLARKGTKKGDLSRFVDEADFLVSGDQHDLSVLKHIEKTKIVAARNFLMKL